MSCLEGQPLMVYDFNFCKSGSLAVSCLNVNCKGFTSCCHMKEAFKMLKNDMCITEIGEAFLAL